MYDMIMTCSKPWLVHEPGLLSLVWKLAFVPVFRLILVPSRALAAVPTMALVIAQSQVPSPLQLPIAPVPIWQYQLLHLLSYWYFGRGSVLSENYVLFCIWPVLCEAPYVRRGIWAPFWPPIGQAGPLSRALFAILGFNRFRVAFLT